jgi:hypothetical protein
MNTNIFIKSKLNAENILEEWKKRVRRPPKILNKCCSH